MPMIDLHAPEGALPAPRLAGLAGAILGAVQQEEGYAGSRFADAISRCWVQEMPRAAVLRGLAATPLDAWRVEIATPVGSLDAAAKARLGREITRLVLAAEGTPADPAQAGRVWCLFRDVAEGDWLAGGMVASVGAIRAAVAREAAG